jgi:predicted permease
MRLERACRFASAAYRRSLQRLEGALPPASLDEAVQVFEDLQRDALRSGGWWALAGCWTNEAIAVRSLRRSLETASQTTIDGRKGRMAMVTWLDSSWRNVRYSLRMLRRTPGFSTVAVLTLALGIGANTTLFSVLYGVLLKALPYPDAAQIVLIGQNVPSSGYDVLGVSKPQLLRLREARNVFNAIGGYGFQDAVLRTATDVEKLTAARVTAGVAEVLGAHVQLGRSLRPADEMKTSEAVVILSDRLWQRVFSGDRMIVGSSVRLDGRAFEVVGVMSRDFLLPDDLTGTTPADLYVPVQFDLAELNWGSYNLTPIARLAPGVSPTLAAAAVRTIFEQLQTEHPGGSLGGPGYAIHVTPLRQEVVKGVASALWMLSAAVALVLLIACANIANLLFARNSARHAEFSLRAALGAGRGDLLRQLLTESLVLTLMGGVLGVGVAALGLRAIRGLILDSVPRATQIGIDLPVFAFTLATSGLAALLVGILPALQTRRGMFTETVRSETRSASASMRQRRVQRALVGSEVALAALLAIGSGLVLKSFYRLIRVNPGFEVDHLLTMQVNLPPARYHDPTQATTFYNDAVARIRALPGVVAASAITGFPLADAAPDGTFEVDRRAVGVPGGRSGHFFYWAVTPGYFETMRLAVTRGRPFSGSDGGSAPAVVIVSDRLADRYWPGESPIGRHVRQTWDSGPPGPWREVVGVVRNVPLHGLNEEPQPEAYFPLVPKTSPDPGWPDRATITIRTAGEPSTLIGPVRAALAGLDRDVPISNIVNVNDLLAHTAAEPRLNMILLSVFAALAIGLAAIGVYGLMAYAVQQRAREMAIRAAVGGRPRHILRLLLGEGLALVAVGLGVGLSGALVLTTTMTRVLFQVAPTDPATFASAAVILLAVGCAAVCIPAWRALRVDIAATLRSAE